MERQIRQKTSEINAAINAGAKTDCSAIRCQMSNGRVQISYLLIDRLFSLYLFALSHR